MCREEKALMDHLVLLWLLCLASFVYGITDQTEVKLLKVFHDKLVGNGLALWDFTNTSDPCSSWALPKQLQLWSQFAGVECNTCTNNTCHITKIYIVSMNVAGQIAPEIGNFTKLADLNLAQNMLTGPIPKEISRLPLIYLSLGKNKFSGTLPPQIGNLSNLKSMGISLNNFTGRLPKEIGNLRNLQGFYFDDNGFEGEIPSEFGGLTSLSDFYGNNNHLNGSIPEIFANMTALSKLRLFGNKFQGKIPSTLWRLTNLEAIYMDGSGISNLSMPSSLVHLKALKELSFRDCGFTGTIPAQIGDLINLNYLDLSFNNFTGEIPSTFGSLVALNKLFLGSNNLSGQLPEEVKKLKNLQYIDISYNKLSGLVPTWPNTSGLNLNWNFFDTSNANRPAAVLFNCLDSKSPCTRATTGKNLKIGINCGGKQLGSYDGDLTYLEYANVSMHQSRRWVVSSTGYVNNVDGDTFDLLSTTTDKIDVSNIPNGTAIEPSIYQTARSSPTSLRYFGLDMVNGNYSVELHFAEIEISANNSKWQSTGKRLFDIYIQGEILYKDFDIINKANGSFKALVVKNIVQVTQGVLEIHFKWSELGTCCIPKSRTFGPLISAIVVTPEFRYSTIPYGRIIGISIGSLGAFLLMCLVTFLCWRRHQQLMLIKQKEDQDFKSIENKPALFTYNELKVATKGFQQQNMLGEGGFGVVYKGVLSDGTVVAIKKLSSSKRDKKFPISSSTKEEFINEICVISSVKHRNLVKLLGCCIEGDHRILVLEFLENNSLQQALFGPSECKLNIDWPTRYNICLEVAKGIAYLHEESLPRIIHRDIKASNILLDKKLHPKIADFGLAKLFGDEETHISTKVAGTLGYLSPEYATRGQLTEKLDVYSFGVLALEIISGRANVALSLPTEKIYLLEWVMQLNKKNSLLQVIDSNLENQYSKKEAMTIIELAILCTQASPNKRPTMSDVVNILSGSNKITTSSDQYNEII